MKYFFDTEFIEWAGGVQLVSIGIVSEVGTSFYAESTQFDERLADEWVKANVLMRLHFHLKGVFLDVPVPGNMKVHGPESYIAAAIQEFIGSDESPEFYAYFASYDWVLFARLFGRLIDKPKHFPMWVIDLKQMMWERGLTKEWKQEVHPDPAGEHDALIDARWNKGLYHKIISAPL